MTFTVTDRGIRILVQFLCISAIAVHALAASAQTSLEPADSLATSHLSDTTAHCILTSADEELQPMTEQPEEQEIPADNTPENESTPPAEQKKSVPQSDSLGVFDMFTNLRRSICV